MTFHMLTLLGIQVVVGLNCISCIVIVLPETPGYVMCYAGRHMLGNKGYASRQATATAAPRSELSSAYINSITPLCPPLASTNASKCF